MPAPHGACSRSRFVRGRLEVRAHAEDPAPRWPFRHELVIRGRSSSGEIAQDAAKLDVARSAGVPAIVAGVVWRREARLESSAPRYGRTVSPVVGGPARRSMASRSRDPSSLTTGSQNTWSGTEEQHAVRAPVLEGVGKTSMSMNWLLVRPPPILLSHCPQACRSLNCRLAGVGADAEHVELELCL